MEANEDDASSSWHGAPPRSISQNAGIDTCVICLQAVTERAITVPCNHCMFDFICLASWLNERPTCPLCAAEVTEVQYDWRSPDDFKSYRTPQPTPKTSQVDSHDQTSRRQTNRNGRRLGQGRRRVPAAALTEDDAVIRRREVYRRHLYSLHVGSNRLSRYRNLTPADFRSDPDLLSRARMFMRRELRVFRYLYPASNASADRSGSSKNAHNAEFLLEYIVAILRTVDVKDSSGQAENMVAEFLSREDAKLFLHELSAWLRSPYVSLQDWDRHVQYAVPLSTTSGRTAGRTSAAEKHPQE